MWLLKNSHSIIVICYDAAHYINWTVSLERQKKTRSGSVSESETTTEFQNHRSTIIRKLLNVLFAAKEPAFSKQSLVQQIK